MRAGIYILLPTRIRYFFHEDMVTKFGRPFSSVEEMNEKLVENWNDVIRSGDQIYHLGDFAFGKNDAVRKFRTRLRGKIHLILGNHDYRNKIERLAEQNCFTSVSDIKVIKINKKRITLCHYCMERWESSHHGSWHLFGHSHNMFHPDGLRFDVGVDTNNFHLLSYDEVAAKMSQRLFKAQTDGRNYVGDEKD